MALFASLELAWRAPLNQIKMLDDGFKFAPYTYRMRDSSSLTLLLFCSTYCRDRSVESYCPSVDCQVLHTCPSFMLIGDSVQHQLPNIPHAHAIQCISAMQQFHLIPTVPFIFYLRHQPHERMWKFYGLQACGLLAHGTQRRLHPLERVFLFSDYPLPEPQF